MADAPFVLFEVAAVAGTEALYLGFDRGAMAAGATLIALGPDGQVHLEWLWRA